VSLSPDRRRSLSWAVASAATVVALASAWHTGGHMWRRLTDDHRTYAAYSSDERKHAFVNAIPLPSNVFDWYRLYVGRGDRIYFQVPDQAFGSVSLPVIVGDAGRFFLLPAVGVNDPKRATVVVSYTDDPGLLRLHYVTQQRLNLQPFFVTRLKSP
jgi:hypothetical protein